MPLAGLGLLGLVLVGCASGSDMTAGAFGDPGKYDLFDCKQLAPERTNLEKRETELRGLMAKARESAGGAVIAEAAYRSELLTVQGQRKFANDAWRSNNCDSMPAADPPAVTSVNPPPPKSDRRHSR
jgi:hypothetical protein